MSLPGSRRTTGGVVAPTHDDPVAQAASGAVGGPLGRHAVTGFSWWTPLRLILAVASIVFSVGVVQKSACVAEKWSDDLAPEPFSHMCYTDIPGLYVGRGLAEGIWPYEPLTDLPVNKQPLTTSDADSLTVEYPVLTGMWMGLTGVVTRAIGDAPDLSQIPHTDIGGNLGVQHDSAVFWSVNAVGFFVALLIGLTFLVRAQPRRPWDAMFVALSPCLALTATINWDLLALAWVGAIFWAWATRRPLLTGVFIGLGAATKLYPFFFLGPLFVLCLRERKLDAWTKTAAAALVAWLAVDLPVYLWSPNAFLWFWQFNSSRGPDFGSLWLVASNYGHPATAHTVNVTTWVVFGAACLGIAALGMFSYRRPRLPQLIFLVIVAFLLVNKVYSPQYVLWLLPLAALARPRWRDLLAWQACEIFYFFAVWMHIANFFVDSGNRDWVYALAVVVRILGELYLAMVVVRDILVPYEDPVRSDGRSDDPLGGILDEGIDAEPPDDPTPRYDAGTDASAPVTQRGQPPGSDRDPIYT